MRFARRGASSKEQPGNGRQQTAHDVDRGGVGANWNTREKGGFRVAADGIEIASPGRGIDQEEHQDRRGYRHVDGNWDLEPTPGANLPREERRHTAHWRSSGVIEGEAAPDR